MTDDLQSGGVLLEPLPLTRRPLPSVLLFSAVRTNLTRAGTLQQPECRGCRQIRTFFFEKEEDFKCFRAVGITITASNDDAFLKLFNENVTARWFARWSVVHLLATFQHSVKNKGYLRILGLFYHPVQVKTLLQSLPLMVPLQCLLSKSATGWCCRWFHYSTCLPGCCWSLRRSLVYTRHLVVSSECLRRGNKGLGECGGGVSLR